MARDIKSILKKTLTVFDRFLISNYLRLHEDRGQLLTFLFHGVFLNRNESKSGVLDPQQDLTLDDYRAFVEYFLKNNYEFISPDQIKNLNRDKKYVLFTFDDGYFNNIRILDLLEEYKVPCTFFISTRNVREQKSFWWDSLYRARFKQGFTRERIYQEGRTLKEKKHGEIERYLTENFGADILKPVSDLDRPMNTTELCEFAKNEYVHIGNHTTDHAILTSYRDEEIVEQILEAQKDLKEMLGFEPKYFAYPNGNYDTRVAGVVKKLGFEMALTCDPKSIKTPVSDDSMMMLGRFCFSPDLGLKDQFLRSRSKVSLYASLNSLSKQL